MAEDFVAIWNRLHSQRSLFKQAEDEVMLEITCPMSYDQSEFRIGWSLKGLRSHSWLAISTGRAIWTRQDLASAAQHVQFLMEAANDFVSDVREPERG